MKRLFTVVGAHGHYAAAESIDGGRGSVPLCLPRETFAEAVGDAIELARQKDGELDQLLRVYTASRS